MLETASQDERIRRNMKLTTKSEYALLALIYIARREDRGFVRIEDICRQYALSRKYMEQILTTLKQNRYVRARRGAGGGFVLARPASRISLAEIIRTMDGPLAPTGSVSRTYFCHTPLEREKKAIRALKEIRNYIADKLEGLKLVHMV